MIRLRLGFGGQVRKRLGFGGRVRGQVWRSVWVLATIGSMALAAQQRDAPAKPVGTGEITGVVWSTDATPQPVRRVVVSLAGGDLPARSVITDDAGRFAFSRLPAGTFAITAKKAAYLATEFGSPKPGRSGSRVALAAGERRTMALTIFKGAVIAGVLRDPSGRPVAGISVAAIDARAVRQGNPLSPETAVTDDRGAYRIFGLMPGEYVISASPSPAGTGEIVARSAADMDAILSALAERQNRVTSVGAGATPITPLPKPTVVGFSPIYFPGTPFFADGARIPVEPGDEHLGVNFEVSHVPVASIEGTVSGEVPNLAAVQLAIIPDAPRISVSTGGITSVPPDERGVFTYGNLPPGRYRIVARARGGPVDPNAPQPAAGRGQATGGISGGAPPPGVILTTTGDMLYAVADIDVRGQDVAGVSLRLQLGGSISGKVVFDALKAPLPDDVTTIRIALSQVGGSYIAQTGGTRVGTALSSVQPVNLNEDGTFAINGLGPALYVVTCQLPADLTPIWSLRSAIADGRDLLDTQVEGPNVKLRGVTLTLSDKRTELSGTLQSASGQPVSAYYVVAFSTDRANWRIGSRRSASARPATNGRFVFADLPAGEYFIAALTDLEPGAWQEAAFLEEVAAAGVRVTIGEGEKKVQDLRIR